MLARFIQQIESILDEHWDCYEGCSHKEGSVQVADPQKYHLATIIGYYIKGVKDGL